MSSEADELENMVLSFRVSELQMLLGFAGRNKSGRKNELQLRALELLRLRSHPVQLKIRELYKTIQVDQLAAHQMYGQQGGDSQLDETMHQRNDDARVLRRVTQQHGGSGVASGKDLPPAHQASMPQSQVARAPPVYPAGGYQTVAAQRSNSSVYAPYPYPTKVLPPPMPLQQPSQYPVHPDVRLKRLPFYDLLGELLKPSSLMPQGSMRLQESTFQFHLTPQQASDIGTYRDCRPGSKMEYIVQVQMRFCLQETSCEQEDYFPPSVQVKVNGKQCPLPNPIPTNKPGVEPKRPPRPVNISPLVKLSPTVANTIHVTWSADYARHYAVAIYMVKKLTSTELLSRLKNRGARHSDYTRGLIKEKLNEDADSEIATTSLRVSLACPLGKMRMSTPCRASTCSHLQCFDASLYLQMNERKPTWNCPVCDKTALYDNLVIDGYFQEVLLSKKLLHDVNEIQLLQDGSWENLVLKKEKDKDKDKEKDKSEVKTESNSRPKVAVDTVDLEYIKVEQWNTSTPGHCGPRPRGRPRKWSSEAERTKARQARKREWKERLRNDPEKTEKYLLQERRRQRIRRSTSGATFKAAIITDINFKLPDAHNLGDTDIECIKCGAKFFKIELKKKMNIFHQCCNFGNVRYSIPKFPGELRQLVEGNDEASQEFRTNIRNYNSAFAMAAQSTTIDSPQEEEIFCLHGKIYHKIPFPKSEQSHPNFAQLYFVESKEAYKHRLKQPCSSSTMALIDQQLRLINPLAKKFSKVTTVMKGELQENQLELLDTSVQVLSQSCNEPTADEIAGVYVNNDDDRPRQYAALRQPGSRVFQIADTDSKCDPLCYPILRPYGDYGWSENMEKASVTERKRTRITQPEYYRFLIAERDQFNILHHAGKLFQQFIVDVFSRIEQNRLNIYKSFQTRNKLGAKKISVWADYFAGDDDPHIGRRTILSSNFTGSPRHMLALSYDFMSIFACSGKPDLAITFACNAHWPEIINNLLPYQTPSDRPDLIARVFHEKLMCLLDDMVKNEVCGTIEAYVWIIEFKKDGIPQAHILFWLEDSDKLKTSTSVNDVIWTKIPDPKNKQLFSVVTTYNLHNRCGSSNSEASCMDSQTGKCIKGFPKSFRETTIMDKDGHPEYDRSMNGPTYSAPDGIVDSRWVIPYNPYLSVKYETHINVEFCSTISAIKYMHNHVYGVSNKVGMTKKSQDNCMEIDYDEIQAYKDMRYISAPEAAWRLFEYDLNGKSHTVVRLLVHLPEQQDACIEDSEEQPIGSDTDTTITGWFALNKKDPGANKCLYCEIPELYRWDNGAWIRRKKHEKIVGRMTTVNPKECERYHLRIMLLYTPGAQSFEDLRTVDDTVYPSFKEAVLAAGYLEDTNEYENCLRNAVRIAKSAELRCLFAFIISACDVHNAQCLWEMFKGDMIDDYLHGGASAEHALALAHAEIKEIVANCGKNLSELLKPPDYQLSEIEDRSVDVERCKKDGQQLYLSLTHEQTEVVNAVLEEDCQCIFIDGPSGSGKTHLFNTLNNLFIGNKRRVLNVAWSGNAANSLPNGQSVQAAFKLPIPIDENNKLSYMTLDSIEAKKLKDVDVIFWDEAPMVPKIALESVDLLLRDIMKADQPFGGKQIVLGGDFRQAPPAVQKELRAEIVESSIKSSVLWHQFGQYYLTDNIRGQPGGPDWTDFILRIGDGTIGDQNGVLKIYEDLLSTGDIVEDVYGDIQKPEDLANIVDRVILVSKNVDPSEINDEVLLTIPGHQRIYRSNDEAMCHATLVHIHLSTELLNAVKPQSYPPHALHLKKGAIVMLLRNLSENRGLRYGTRLVIQDMSRYHLGCKIASGSAKGNYVLIPRITFLPSPNDPMTLQLRRRQFPVKLAFAIPIHESQGQTFSRVGLYLPSSIVSHGELYMALSRVRSRDQLKILLPSETKTVNNVVFKEMLL